MYEYCGRLISMTDADTLRVEIVLIDEQRDLGFGIARHMHETVPQKLRLYGVQAPERYTTAGKAATAWVLQWLTEHCPDGVFTVNTFKGSYGLDKQEKYGRYLAIITAPDGQRLNDDLVATGNAVPYMVS